MVRTYWFVPIFHEAIGVLDLQPSARPAPSKPVVPGSEARRSYRVQAPGSTACRQQVQGTMTPR